MLELLETYSSLLVILLRIDVVDISAHAEDYAAILARMKGASVCIGMGELRERIEKEENYFVFLLLDLCLYLLVYYKLFYLVLLNI